MRRSAARLQLLRLQLAALPHCRAPATARARGGAPTQCPYEERRRAATAAQTTCRPGLPPSLRPAALLRPRAFVFLASRLQEPSTNIFSAAKFSRRRLLPLPQRRSGASRAALKWLPRAPAAPARRMSGARSAGSLAAPAAKDCMQKMKGRARWRPAALAARRLGEPLSRARAACRRPRRRRRRRGRPCTACWRRRRRRRRRGCARAPPRRRRGRWR